MYRCTKKKKHKSSRMNIVTNKTVVQLQIHSFYFETRRRRNIQKIQHNHIAHTHSFLYYSHPRVGYTSQTIYEVRYDRETAAYLCYTESYVYINAGTLHTETSCDYDLLENTPITSWLNYFLQYKRARCIFEREKYCIFNIVSSLNSYYI